MDRPQHSGAALLRLGAPAGEVAPAALVRRGRRAAAAGSGEVCVVAPSATPLVGGRRDVHYQVLQVEEVEDEKLLRLMSKYQVR